MTAAMLERTTKAVETVCNTPQRSAEVTTRSGGRMYSSQIGGSSQSLSLRIQWCSVGMNLRVVAQESPLISSSLATILKRHLGE